MMKTLVTIAALVSLAAAGYAVETMTWLDSSQDDFQKGTLRNLSLRSDGRLTLAPNTEELLDSSTAVLWAVAEDSKGNVYVGGGGPGARSAKVFRVTANGESATIAELEGLQVQAIAVNANDEVFAATAPDGKVYRIPASGEAEVFFDPEAKYIWSMVFGETGDLFIGTGDSGHIYRVKPDGQGSVFFKTEETHARSLAVDGAGNLIVGTEPSGLIMRVTAAGEGFVLHQSEKREVTAVAVAPDGNIYASAVGNKGQVPAVRPPAPATPPAQRRPTSAAATSPQAPSGAPSGQPARAARTPIPGLRAQVTGGSEVYRISPDGYPRAVWSDKTEVVYGIAIDGEGRAVLGTGNDGRIYRLDTDHLSTMLVQMPSAQITAISAGSSGRLYAVTSNIGKLYGLGPESGAEGSYEGNVLDAEHFSYWGRIGFLGETAGGVVGLTARSGNLDRPQQNWSSWAPVALNDASGRVEAPPSRFLQYKLMLKASPSGASPAVRSVEVAYLHKNVAPVLEKIAATPPNYRFPPQVLSLTKNRNLTLSPLSASKRVTPTPVKASGTQTMQYEKGHIGARWLARDDNSDALEFKVEIRGERENEWKLLEEELTNAYVSWDSTAFADGEYRLRVTASDASSNPPQRALTAVLEGGPFLIDNTPPAVEGLAGSVDGGKLTAQWTARDGNTTIKKAEYSLNGGEWRVVEAVSKLSDSKELRYSLSAAEAENAENTLAVRVTDSFDNQAVAKLVVR